MAEIAKKTTKKVIKKAVTRLNPEAQAQKAGVRESSDNQRTDARVKKYCAFCESKTTPVYTDINSLRRFLTERSKIVPKLRSGACSKHQRRITTHIKYARHLGLLPFTPGV